MKMDADLGVPWNPWSQDAVACVLAPLGARDGGNTARFRTGDPFWMQLHGRFHEFQATNMVQVGQTTWREYKRNRQVVAIGGATTPIWMQQWKWCTTLGAGTIVQHWKRQQKDVVEAKFECDGSACESGYVFCFVGVGMFTGAFLNRFQHVLVFLF